VGTSDLRDQLQTALGTTYTLERELGRGGMATVYLAQDMKHHRSVALKVLHAELAASLGPERFRREIELAARLQHPHILSVFDSGETGAGQLWFTMPYVEGESLRERLRRTKQLSLEDAVRITREVAGALAYAHQHGVIHRDIKPENILLTTQGDALLADFGIARALAADSSSTGTLTQTGTAVGTPQYMSPEQATGERDVTAQTDIYSLGAVCYEMLTGEPPFTGATAQAVIAKMMTSPAPSARVARPSVPEALDETVRKALAPVPADRFATAAGFATALESAERTAAGQTAPAAPSSAILARPADRRFPLAAASLLLGLLIGGGALFAWRSHAHARGTPEGKPSIAVLPFENLGDSADAYFADGMTDEVRGKLTALSGLAVIAGASSNQYRHTTKTPQEIGRELGVRYLLVGKVRWDKHAGPGAQSEVRVEPELMQVADVATPTTKWQQPFDAPLTNVFQVQGQIAEQVVQALHVALDSGQHAGLSTRPTESIPAYEEYLRGNEATGTFTNFYVPSLKEAAEHYEKAVTIDPTFAMAWARLGRVRIDMVYQGGTLAAERWAQGRQAAERALALSPNLPAAHLTLGVSHIVHNEWEPARQQLELGRRVAPDDPDLLENLWEVDESEGRYEAGLALLEHARAVDPRSGNVAYNLAAAYIARRRCRDARKAIKPALELAPHAQTLVVIKAAAYLCEGDLPGAREVVRTAIAQGDSTALLALTASSIADRVYLRLPVSILDDAAQRAALGLRPADFDDQRHAWALALARVYALRGDSVRMRAYADSARGAATDALRAAPDDPGILMALAYAEALVGHRDAALHSGERAVALVPISRDGSFGPNILIELAQINVLLGRHDEAITQLEAALAVPSFISPGALRADPSWAPLRGNSRFERLVAQPAPTPPPAK
jgi:eukaryotic-like serine/threonine-protein kinase